jgi:HEAT repeat protein
MQRDPASSTLARVLARDPLKRRWLRNVLHRADRSDVRSSERLRQAARDRDVDVLLDALTDPERRRAALSALEVLGDRRAARPVERLLQAGDWRVRGDAARALGKVGDEVSVTGLREALADDVSPFVRIDAVSGLCELPGPAATEALAAALDDESASVRRHAAAALAERGDARGIEELQAQRNPFRPRTLDLARWAAEPEAPLPVLIAVPLAAAWIVTVSIAVDELAGVPQLVAAAAGAIGFNELWLRLREREARKRRIYVIPREVEPGCAGTVATLLLPVLAALYVLVVGSEQAYGLWALTIFLWSRRVLVEVVERASEPYRAFLAGRPRR